MRQERKRKMRRSKENVENTLLFRYLKGDLSEQERYNFELQLNEDPFLSDAVEGLSQLDEKNMEQGIRQINHRLFSQIKKNKARHLPFSYQKIGIWIAVVIILLFIFITWWYIQIILK